MKREAEAGGRCPQAQDCQQPPEAEATGKPSPLESSEAGGHAGTLILDFWSPELREYVSVVVSHPVCGQASRQPQEPNTAWARTPLPDQKLQTTHLRLGQSAVVNVPHLAQGPQSGYFWVEPFLHHLQLELWHLYFIECEQIIFFFPNCQEHPHRCVLLDPFPGVEFCVNQCGLRQHLILCPFSTLRIHPWTDCPIQLGCVHQVLWLPWLINPPVP